jgi:hypothetical protein
MSDHLLEDPYWVMIRQFETKMAQFCERVDDTNRRLERSSEEAVKYYDRFYQLNQQVNEQAGLISGLDTRIKTVETNAGDHVANHWKWAGLYLGIPSTAAILWKFFSHLFKEVRP